MTGRWRSTGWDVRLHAMETVGPLPADHDVEEAMRLTWGPALEGDAIVYQVHNPKQHFGAGTVYDHLHVVGVGIEDGIELTNDEETRPVEDELWPGSTYDGAIGLPTDLPDGIYACTLTADCLRTVEPRPQGAVAFRVEGGVIQPWT